MLPDLLRIARHWEEFGEDETIAMGLIFRYNFGVNALLRQLAIAGGCVACFAVVDELGAQEVPGVEMRSISPRAAVVEARTTDWGDDYQIRVQGGDPRTRVIFRNFAEEIRRDFRFLLFPIRRPESVSDRWYIPEDSWKVPLAIDLWGSPGDVGRGRTFIQQVEIRPDNRFLIRISVRLHERLDEAAFRREIVRGLLYEQILLPIADSPGSLSNPDLKPPDWIVWGFDQLIEHRRAGQPSASYEGLLKSAQVMRPEAVFQEDRADRLDPLTEELFRVSASALLDALLEQEDGDISMRAYLADVGLAGDGDARTSEALLRKHFPAIREVEQGLDKWWALQVANLGSQGRFEYLPPDETNERLSEVLVIRLAGGEVTAPQKGKGLLQRFGKAFQSEETIAAEPFVGTLAQWEDFHEHPQANAELAACIYRLQYMKLVGFPLYRPVFDQYEVIVERIARQEFEDLDTLFTNVVSLRETITMTLEATQDHLNHFEATQSPRRSREFDDYWEFRRDLESDLQVPRRDLISRYLDEIEDTLR
ncbi:MAG: hypothetical protein AAF236_11025 [Verrucomicrobiota bacterium]